MEHGRRGGGGGMEFTHLPFSMLQYQNHYCQSTCGSISEIGRSEFGLHVA